MTTERQRLQLGLVGATGMMGREILAILEARESISVDLVLLGSGDEEVGEVFQFRGQTHRVEQIDLEAVDGLDVVIFAGGPNMSRRYGREVSESGGVAVDVAGGFRAVEDVPVLLPGVNVDRASFGVGGGLVACPRPASAILARVLKPIRDLAGARRVVVSTYQAVTDAGEVAIEEFSKQILTLFQGGEAVREILPKKIACNCIPQVGAFLQGGLTEEEALIAAECRQILLAPNLAIEVTSAFVPVFSGDSLAVTVETEDAVRADAVRAALAETPGVEVIDDPKREDYPVNMDGTQGDAILVGRVRPDRSLPEGRGVSLWATADNVRVSALCAVELAEAVATRIETM